MSTHQVSSKVWLVENQNMQTRLDYLAREEPLEIRLVEPPMTLAVTMRTPGADFDLAAGFLYSEGIIHQREDLQQMSHCEENILLVTLRTGLSPNIATLERHFFTNSSCGVCGKTSLESLKLRGYQKLNSLDRISCQVLYQLPERLRGHQRTFNSTGGLHAAALFDLEGNLIKIREDIGRHNALDKLIGSAFLASELPLKEQIIMVSGRTSFELLQKSISAQVPFLVAVSAPSSLAVTLAQEFGLTLIGFLRDGRFNVYSGIERIKV